MSKRIILCADGTWDKSQNDTNVSKLFKAAKNQPGQAAFYDDGVGSDGTPFEKLTGGAFGEGLFKKIRAGYKQIAQVYQPDDDIFLFGFSRGAYTARSIAGMIAVCGLPTANIDDTMVGKAFQAYRSRDQRVKLLADLDIYEMFNAKLKMVGVWDTVGALGIPAVVGGVDPLMYGFLDTNLHPDVSNAYHALAIDERREEFPPTLWTPPNPPVAGQAVEQVWFAGVHCDVGGGYPETGLSDITFSWMLDKAVKLGLQVDPAVSAQYAQPFGAKSALDTLHESWNPLWLLPQSRTVPGNAALGNSVAIRCQQDNSYRPGNLTVTGGAPANSYTITPVVA